MRRLRSLIFLVAACASPPAPPTRAPASPPPPPTAVRDDAAIRIRVALAEARRADGVAELAALARDPDVETRVLALRGLGRTGGPAARKLLVETLAAPLPDRARDVAAAAYALGIAASLDETPPDPATDAALARLLASPTREVVVAAVDAIGRAGDVALQAPLVAAAREPAVAEHVALAFGRFARRKLVLEPASRSWLAGHARSAVHGVRFAAVFALSREVQAPTKDATEVGTAALVVAAGDPDPEIAAMAIAGVGRRKVAVAIRPPTDWRGRTELARYLTREDATPAELAAAAALVDDAVSRTAADPANAHVAIEALRGLSTRAPGRGVKPPATAALPALTRGWIDCLAIVRTLRAPGVTTFAPIETCGDGGLPDHLRLPLVVPLIEAPGALPPRRAALRKLLAHRDLRVRAAGLAGAAALWKAGAASDRRDAAAALVAAIASKDTLFAGAALEAALPVLAAPARPDAAALVTRIEAAIAMRAATESDVELAAALYGLVGQRKLAAGADACRRGLVGHPASARAAASCLEQLGAAEPARPTAIPLPPVDVRTVIGKRLHWNLLTTRGMFIVELRGDVAPWAVAAIVALTERRYYDGLELHRVVPNFVVQGGDPTESGWGGPGFLLPSEPSVDPGFVTGGVGIADAGRDSGGSQWFVMHARTPHLDGRYTWFGRVLVGQGVADELLVGDSIVGAAIVVPADRPAP